MPRDDISSHLVHWTKGESYDDAFEIMRAIVSERRLLGSNTHIRGGQNCVCFTEAPEGTFHQVAGKYKPFGIQIPKKWVFERGGRPVIYQTEAEFGILPEALRWRHMRYELNRNPPVDFSWEREWRIQVDELPLEPECTRLLVPDSSWAQALVDEHEDRELGHFRLTASVYGEEWLAAPIDEFAFKYTVITV